MGLGSAVPCCPGRSLPGEEWEGSAFVVLRICGLHTSRSPQLATHSSAAGAASVPRGPCPAASPLVWEQEGVGTGQKLG